jgi:hypothetical protein
VDVIHESPFLPHGLLVPITTYTHPSRFSFRVLRTSRPGHLQAILQSCPSSVSTTWTRHLSDGLDKLLHDEEYVHALEELPERELVQLVNHLNNVRFSL